MENSHCRQLTEKILALLADGIATGESVHTYMSSTFSNPSLHRIREIIRDDSDAERDSLVDLLLFPDEVFQLKLEPFLTQHHFTRDGEEEIIRHLSAMSPTVVIHLPVFNKSIHFRPVSTEIRQLVIRLNITWQAEKIVHRAIDSHIAPGRQSLVRVHLRNSGLTMNAPGSRLLVRFLHLFDDSRDRFFDYFRFMIDFLGRMLEEAPYQALMREKRRLVKALEQAVRFEQLLERGNMETLMLQGKRAPAEPTTLIRKNIATIDDIAMALFNRTESDLL